MKRSEYKVPGGKLLRVKAETENGLITFLQVTGDFFMAPVTDLEELESLLLGGPAEYNFLKQTIRDFFNSKETKIAGASPGDFVKVITEALGL